MIKKWATLAIVAGLGVATMAILKLPSTWWQEAQHDVSSENMEHTHLSTVETPSQVLDNTATLESFNLRIASLEKDISDLRHSMQRLVDRLDAEGNSDIVTNDITERDDQSRQVSANSITMGERTLMFDNALSYTSQDDEIWSTATEIEVAQTIASSAKLGVAESQRVQCAGSMCRIEVVLPADIDPLQKEFYSTELLQSMAGSLPRGTFDTRTNADGSVNIVFYLARAGYTLPSVSNPLGASLPTEH